jgi:hypothetical protein
MLADIRGVEVSEVLPKSGGTILAENRLNWHGKPYFADSAMANFRGDFFEKGK